MIRSAGRGMRGGMVGGDVLTRAVGMSATGEHNSSALGRGGVPGETSDDGWVYPSLRKM